MAEYLEAQQTELEVLKSIYNEDFIEDHAKLYPNKPNVAWGKVQGAALPEFGISLKSQDEKLREEVGVVLIVKYSKTYPKVSPTLTLAHPKGISNSQVAQLTRLIHAKAKEEMGQVVVFDIATFIEEWVTDHHNISDKTVNDGVSLLVEMGKREEENKAALAQSAFEEKKKLEELRKAQALDITLQLESHQKKLQTKTLEEQEAQSRDQSEWTAVSFSKEEGLEGTWNFVGPGIRKRVGTEFVGVLSDDFDLTTLATPSISSLSLSDDSSSNRNSSSAPDYSFLSDPSSAFLSVRIIDFENPYYATTQGQSKLSNLVSVCHRLLPLPSTQIVPLLSIKLCQSPKGWPRLCLLSQRTERQERLREVLKVSGRLDLTAAVDHLIQILAGLEALKKHGLTHDHINLDTVVLSSSEGARLSEPTFRRRIVDMDRSNPFLPASSTSETELDIPFNWKSPDEVNNIYSFTAPRDMWHAGITFLRMVWGMDVLTRYTDVTSLLASDEIEMLDPIPEVLKGMLHSNPHQRLSAAAVIYKLSTVQLRYQPRKSQTLLTDMNSRTPLARSPGVFTGSVPFFNNSVMNAAGHAPQFKSRYQEDFEEVEFLGAGGFGKVVKAKKRLDGMFYAIKKVKLRPEDNEQKVFREVNALSRLDHRHIVRYYSCWLEVEDNLQDTEPSPSPPVKTPVKPRITSAVMENAMSNQSENSSASTSAASSTNGTSHSATPEPFDDDMLHLQNDDFLSVRGRESRSTSFPSIHFGADDDEDDDEEESDEDSDENGEETDVTNSDDGAGTVSGMVDSSPAGTPSGQTLENTNASSVVYGSRTLYIQMEYVENQTLKETIAAGLTEENAWRLFRQILEALEHMSSLGIVHRDLKPSNLMIDREGDIKIGDFGLAATDTFNSELSAQNSVVHSPPNGGHAVTAAELTSGIGTSLYIAPEVESRARKLPHSEGRYNDKADLYSLGIIFFEMCFPFETAMERAFVVRDLRSPKIIFPPAFPKAALPVQTEVIQMLLQHDPSKRPRAKALLESGKIPEIKKDEYFKEALRTYTNHSSSKYPILFEHIYNQSLPGALVDYTFQDAETNPREHRVYEGIVKDLLSDLFRRHGAIDWATPLLLPVTELLEYRKDHEGGARFFTRQGKLVELPYDGLVSFAREIARSKRSRLKRYHFGTTYRESSYEGQPLTYAEATYDILSPVRSMASEAEIIEVLDKVLDTFPGLSRFEWEFHISHTSVHELILQHVPAAARLEVCDILREVSGKVTFKDVRAKLTVTRPVLETLEKWCITDTFEGVMQKLFVRFPTQRIQLERAVSEIRSVLGFINKLGVSRKVLFRPTVAHRSFTSGIVFECIRKVGKREVLAVGGRYDNMIDRFRIPHTTTQRTISSHVAGMQIALEKIAYFVGKHESTIGKNLINSEKEETRSFGWTPRRCDIYVVSFSPGLMEERMNICGELWKHGLSADLMYDDGIVSTMEEVIQECLAQGILYVVITKGPQLLKIRSVLRSRAETDERRVNRDDLVPQLRQLIGDQRRIDSNASGPSSTASHLDLTSVPSSKTVASPDLVRLILPIEKGGSKDTRPVKKQFRHQSKNLWYEKARTYQAQSKSQLQIIGLDISAALLNEMSFDSSWLDQEESWRNIKDRFPANHPGYANVVREELKDIKDSEGAGTLIVLFAVREERGFLFQL